MGNKFGARRMGGFDSQLERREYTKARLMEQAGQVFNLIRQPRFEIIPRLEEVYTEQGVRKVLVKRRVLEKAAHYTADFQYDTKEGVHVVCEVKGKATAKEADYILRRKLVRQLFARWNEEQGEKRWTFKEIVK